MGEKRGLRECVRRIGARKPHAWLVARQVLAPCRALIAAGEESGDLAQVMERLADYIEERNNLRSKILTAFIYPGVVGLVSNGIGYLLYLGITAAGVGPKLAMTILYVIGVMQSFIFNKGWSR